MKGLLSFAVALGAASAQYSTGGNGSTPLPVVDLGYEIYRATGYNDSGRFYNFSNIRYAAPPIGNLRLALPEAPATNRSSVNDGSVGRICPQATPAWSALSTQVLTNSFIGISSANTPIYTPSGANSISNVTGPGPLETEDCLFLDVFVPEKILARANSSGYGAPVLVWIYGGGYVGGSKYNNPAGLLAESGKIGDAEVVYVSINYRLGALGLTSGPSFNAEGGVSNLALYDQRFALEWVQKNIHLFGGDKDRVTVFGESAGGGSIMHQITAYGGSKGPAPFQQAVPQSPGWTPTQSSSYQEDIYQKFLTLTNSSSLADLRELSTEAVIRANTQQIAYDPPWGSYVYSPVVDGLFVPLLPGQLLAQGRFDKNVRVMVGHNTNEGPYFTPPYANSTERIASLLKSTIPNIPQSSVDYLTDTLYPAVFDGSQGYTNNYTRASKIVSEGFFTCNTNYLSTGFQNKTFSYLFAVPPAYHGFDVAYTFFDGGATSRLPTGVANRTVAVALQEFITSFAKTGVPEAEGIKKFQMYGPDAKVLELKVTGIEEVHDSNASKRCNWWQKGLVS
ncbi:carboxylesterase family protein-like protein [Karstenula rhodostoma CBS 690.94]|uniref:Carboxylic ester hydrolase n=1 Tax=Karstenula rhodostoma CBS 690.94 TaxID=1392251 RepID=A0A9P4PJ09_9PLEO|nr:carboxylesterase family protein-like protein [Karstenula rhodostoma CBS 690.94]